MVVARAPHSRNTATSAGSSSLSSSNQAPQPTSSLLGTPNQTSRQLLPLNEPLLEMPLANAANPPSIHPDPSQHLLGAVPAQHQIIQNAKNQQVLLPMHQQQFMEMSHDPSVTSSVGMHAMPIPNAMPNPSLANVLTGMETTQQLNGNSSINDPNLRLEMYKLISSQLSNDGHADVVSMLINRENINLSDCTPSNKLEHLVMGKNELEQKIALGNQANIPIPTEYDPAEVQKDSITHPSPSFYKLGYITTHKEACLSAAFSADGSLFATGSDDKSIKIIDTHRVISRTDFSSDVHSYDLHPVVRTICDGSDSVNVLKFHPTEHIIFSGCKDGAVNAFSFSKNSHKRAFLMLNEVGPIQNLEIFPKGLHMLLTINHPTIRLYEIETMKCFVSPVAKDQHTNIVTNICIQNSKGYFVSASRDRSFKIWDSRSCRSINTIPNAHNTRLDAMTILHGYNILATAGFDDVVKIWDMSMLDKPVLRFQAPMLNQHERSSKCFLQFNNSSEYLMMTTSNSNQIMNWKIADGTEMPSTVAGHNGIINDLKHSPTHSTYITCSSDHRARISLFKM